MASGERGFTLTELAIVFGVVAIISGAIWVAAGQAWASYHTHKTERQLTQVSQNIRDQYKGAQTPATWGAAGANITLILDAVNAFPQEMRRFSNLPPGNNGEAIDNDFSSTLNGSVQVFYVGAAGANGIPSAGSCAVAGVPCFRVWLYGLPPNGCIGLLSILPIDDEESGIANMGVTNTTGSCTGATCTTTTAVPASTAAAWCNGKSRDNTVFWDFKLH